MNVTFETPVAKHDGVLDCDLPDFIDLLDRDLPQPCYLIMEREGADRDHYIQAMPLPEGGFAVNYREGSCDKDYETRVETKVQVALLFFAYLHLSKWPNVLDVQWRKTSCGSAI